MRNYLECKKTLACSTSIVVMIRYGTEKFFNGSSSMSESIEALMSNLVHTLALFLS